MFYITLFIGDLKETGSLVYGPGSKNDSSGKPNNIFFKISILMVIMSLDFRTE